MRARAKPPPTRPLSEHGETGRSWVRARIIADRLAYRTECDQNVSAPPQPKSPRPHGEAIDLVDPLGVQELALSTVTARRFCDQQEMSSQTATGRSLP